MSIAKDVAGIVPGLQAAALVGHNMKALNFNKNMKLGRSNKVNFKKSSGKMVKLGVTNLVGVSLIGATAGAVNGLQ